MMTNEGRDVFVGVDTHRDVHHAAVLDVVGREIDDRRFATTPDGYRALTLWAQSHGRVVVAAVEGTSSYGAGLTRALIAAGWDVRETVPGDKADRRLRGKSDGADAFTAARAAASGRATAIPKDTSGTAEEVRVLRDARRLLVRQQTQLMNQIKALLVTAPSPTREANLGLTPLRLAQRLAGSTETGALATVLRRNAHHWLTLRADAATYRTELGTLLERTTPKLMAVPGVGPDTAAALLVAVGHNSGRIRSEAALAHFFGIAPIPASSGNHTRHRLDRGGNRQGNAAIHRIALVRLSHDPTTRDFITKTTARGKTRRDAMRILKRHLIREIYPILCTT